MPVSPEFFRRDVNSLVIARGSDALVNVTMRDGRNYYVRRVVETRETSVVLHVYSPSAAKPFVESSSAMHVLAEDFPGSYSAIELSLPDMTSAEVRSGSARNRHIRFESPDD